MKLNGIAIATATAWAGSSPIPLRTSNSRAIRLTISASTLTVKNRAAWNPACPCFASKVQWRFHQKLFDDRDAEGDDRGWDVVDVERPDHDREHREVDDVAGAADQPELEELHPVLWLQGAAADPFGGLNRGHP